mmetsp:Transcript_3567/g.5262  ORF Transcript_3567/g.5262 Transcript_3567/m.5262 type:complete len:88 (-) Transcript_3567:460-723(-)
MFGKLHTHTHEDEKEGSSHRALYHFFNKQWHCEVSQCSLMMIVLFVLNVSNFGGNVGDNYCYYTSTHTQRQRRGEKQNKHCNSKKSM